MHAASLSEEPSSPWDVLRVLLDALIDLFGAPNALAEQEVVTRRDYFEISQWLKPLEWTARWRIFMRAFALMAPPEKAAKHKGKAAPPAPAEPPAEKTVTLRGRFALTIPAWRFRKLPLRGPRAPFRRPTLSSLGLAVRIAGLSRAIDAPEAYAIRLAKRLSKDRRLFSRFMKKPALQDDVNPAGALYHDSHRDVCALIRAPGRNDTS